MSEVPHALVVVPARDEHECIGAVVDDVVAAGFACLVVDDGSSDSTVDVARRAGAVVIALDTPTGVGAAMRVGCRYALDHGYECVVRVDADGQHPAEAITLLLAALSTSDADMAVGSRFASSASYRVPVVRRAVLGVLRGALAFRTGQWHTDPTSGLRAVRRPLLDAIAEHLRDHYLGDTFELSLHAVRAGYSVIEVPVSMRARQGGTSSVSRRAALRHTVESLAAAARSGPALPERAVAQPGVSGPGVSGPGVSAPAGPGAQDGGQTGERASAVLATRATTR